MNKDVRLSPEAAAAAARICACFNVRRTARSVTRYFDEALQGAGLRATQFVMLVTLHASKSIGMPALGETLGLDRSAVTRRLQPLAREGLVRIMASRAAGPSRVELTAKGVRKLESAVPLWEEAQGRVVAEIGQDRWGQVLEDLAGMRRAVGEG